MPSSSYYRRHRDRLRAYFAAWQAEHRAERSEYERRRLSAKPELARAARLRRRDARAAEYRAWCQANRDRVRYLNARRRARERNAVGTHTWQEWKAKKELLGCVCFYCGEAKPLSVDHKIPLSRGGRDAIENVLPACFSCNASKNDRTAAEYLALRRCA